MTPSQILVVMSYAVPGREPDLGRWLAERHIPELLAVPGVEGAVQYVSLEIVKLPPQVGRPDFTVIYALGADDPDSVIAEIDCRSLDTEPSPALDAPRTIALLCSAACVLEPRWATDDTPTTNTPAIDKPLLFAATYAQPGREQDLWDCYDTEHVPDLMVIPGIGTVVRYTVKPLQLPEGVPPPATLLLHEIEPGSGEAFREEVKVRHGAGQIRHTSALNGTRTIALVVTPT